MLKSINIYLNLGEDFQWSIELKIWLIKKQRKKNKRVSKKIEKDYAGEEVYCVGLLKGSVIFLSDLVKEINIPVIIDFMSVSSYGSETVSSGDVKILKDTDLDLRGKHV